MKNLEKIHTEQVSEGIIKAIDKNIIDSINGKAQKVDTTRYGQIRVIRTIDKEVDHCWNCCPYFTSYPMGLMECTHPYFKDKEPYAGYIIGWNENIQHGFPSKCPLFRKPE